MYCTIDDVKKYLDEKIVTQVVTKRSGFIEGHISDVTSETDDYLRGRYVLPLSSTPAVINRCCAVLVAYRTLGGITGVMDTDATTNNALMYLQKQAAAAEKLLLSIRDGEMNLGLKESSTDSGSTDNEVLVITQKRTFDLRGY